MFSKSGILIFIFAENNYSIHAHAMLIKTPLLHQSFGPLVSFFLYLSLFLDDSLERRSRLRNPGNISLYLFHSLIVDSGPPGSGPLKDQQMVPRNRDSGTCGKIRTEWPPVPIEAGKY